jgi:hypothetical protein
MAPVPIAPLILPENAPIAVSAPFGHELELGWAGLRWGQRGSLHRNRRQSHQARAGCDDDAHCQPLLLLHDIIGKKPSRIRAFSCSLTRQTWRIIRRRSSHPSPAMLWRTKIDRPSIRLCRRHGAGYAHLLPGADQGAAQRIDDLLSVAKLYQTSHDRLIFGPRWIVAIRQIAREYKRLWMTRSSWRSLPTTSDPGAISVPCVLKS